jgi:hypothetical protein
MRVGRGGVLDLAAGWAAPEACLTLDTVHRFIHTDVTADGDRVTVADDAYARLSLAMRTGSGPDAVFDVLLARHQIRLHPDDADRIVALAGDAVEALRQPRLPPRPRQLPRPGRAHAHRDPRPGRHCAQPCHGAARRTDPPLPTARSDHQRSRPVAHRPRHRSRPTTRPLHPTRRRRDRAAPHPSARDDGVAVGPGPGARHPQIATNNSQRSRTASGGICRGVVSPSHVPDALDRSRATNHSHGGSPGTEIDPRRLSMVTIG